MATNLEYIYTLKDKYSKQLAAITKKQMEFSKYYLQSMGKMNAAAIKHREVIQQSKRSHTDYTRQITQNINRITSSYARQTKAMQTQMIAERKQHVMRKKAIIAQKVGSTSSRSGGIGALAGGIGGGMFLRGALDTMVSFKTNLNAIKAVDQSVDLDLMGRKAMEWGRKTRFSAVAVTAAMREAAQAGMKQNEILKTMPGNIALAAAGQMTLQDAMMLSTDVVNQFGKEVSNQQWADILAKGAANSTSRVQQLGAALQNTGTQAFQAGVKSKDLMVALMGIGETGLRGEAGGTFMSNMFARLGNMTPKLQKGMTQFLAGSGSNLSDIYDVKTKQFKDFNKFMDLLSTSGKEKVSGLKGAFGMQGSKAIGALAQLSPMQLLKFRMEMLKTEGAAQEMADTLMAGLPGAMIRLDSAWETSQLVMMESFVPALSAVVEGMANLLAHLQKDHPWILKVALVTIGLTTAIIAVGTALWIASGALGAWGIALGFGWKAILLFTTKAGLMTVGINILSWAINAGTFGFKLWAGAVWLVNAAMAANPIGLIIIGIAALVALLTLCVTKTNNWTDAMKLLGGIMIKSFLTPMNLVTFGMIKLLEVLSMLPTSMGGDLFGKMSKSLGESQNKLNELMTGNKSLTVAGMIYDIYQDEKGGSTASSWIKDTTKRSADDRNYVMQNNISVTGEIGVRAEQGTAIPYSSFDFNTGDNMGGV